MQETQGRRADSATMCMPAVVLSMELQQCADLRPNYSRSLDNRLNQEIRLHSRLLLFPLPTPVKKKCKGKCGDPSAAQGTLPPHTLSLIFHHLLSGQDSPTRRVRLSTEYIHMTAFSFYGSSSCYQEKQNEAGSLMLLSVAWNLCCKIGVAHIGVLQVRE